MIFVAGAAFCQDITGKTLKYWDSYSFKQADQSRSGMNTYSYFHNSNNKRQIQPESKTKPGIFLSPVSCSVINADYYTQNFGFFCKKELQFEKATKIPLRFRLGSLQYNDYLEQKPNAVNLF